MNYLIKNRQRWAEYDSEHQSLLSLLADMFTRRLQNADDLFPKHNTSAEVRTGANAAIFPLTISAAGAGGKTSLLLHLAKESRAQGMSTLVTTTTHMFLPESSLTTSLPCDHTPYAESSPARENIACFTGASVFSETEAAPSSPEIIWLGLPVEPEIREGNWIKCHAPSPETLETCRQNHAITLIEADGSRRLPIKVPGKQEPVIPDFTHIILVVYGLSALGQPFRQVCQRWELLNAAVLNSADLSAVIHQADRTGPGESAYAQCNFPCDTAAVTPRFMGTLMREYYIKPLSQNYPKACILPVWNQADTFRMVQAAKEAAHWCGCDIQLITHFSSDKNYF